MNACFVTAIFIAGLGSDDFAKRERCDRVLRLMGDNAIFSLLIAEQSRNTEIAVRARKILSSWHAANAERWADSLGKLPWIWDHHHYLTQARKKTGFCSGPDWTDYREATRLLVIDLYSNRRCDEVPGMLAEFVDRDREWLRQNVK